MANSKVLLMAYDEQMASRFRDELLKLGVSHVEEKSMFGALGFMINGKLAVCVGSEDVMYKFSTERCNELINEGIAEPVTMGKRTMKDWVTIYFYNLEDPKQFQVHLRCALDQSLQN